jgi:hypothetical protein
VIGQFALAPGERGVAWVLTEQEQADLERWRTTALGDPDPLARREAIYALRPWLWGADGPLPDTAPLPIPPGFLTDVSDDASPVVRRALLELVRDLRDPENTLEAEVADVLATLVTDGDKRVAKAAYTALAGTARKDVTPAIDAWNTAFEGVLDPGPRGRSAAITLAKLGAVLPVGPDVDAEVAVARTIAHHPEQAWRVWNAWRDAVPYHDDWARTLLGTTVNLNQGLVKHWGAYEAGHLAAAIRDWEPAEPHSERWRVLGLWLADTENEELRAALGL